jgi:hypothetical protein
MACGCLQRTLVGLGARIVGQRALGARRGRRVVAGAADALAAGQLFLAGCRPLAALQRCHPVRRRH